MKTLVIYDLTGKIWNIVYGDCATPQGIPCTYVDIPEGAQIESMDLTDPENPKAIFTYLPESDIGRLQKQVNDILNIENTNIEILADVIGGAI